MPNPSLHLPYSCARCGSQVERPGLHFCDFCRPDAPPAPSAAPAAIAEAPAALGVRSSQTPEQAEVTLQLALLDLRKRYPELVHPDQAAVRRFTHAMELKMAVSRSKGRSGWQKFQTHDLQALLREHLPKGDPVDVANFCMMLWDRRAKVVA